MAVLAHVATVGNLSCSRAPLRSAIAFLHAIVTLESREQVPAQGKERAVKQLIHGGTRSFLKADLRAAAVDPMGDSLRIPGVFGWRAADGKTQGGRTKQL